MDDLQIRKVPGHLFELDVIAQHSSLAHRHLVSELQLLSDEMTMENGTRKLTSSDNPAFNEPREGLDLVPNGKDLVCLDLGLGGLSESSPASTSPSSSSSSESA